MSNMRPADKTPASGIACKPLIYQPSREISQVIDMQRVGGKVLLIEQPSIETTIFIEQLHAAVGCRIDHERCVEHGLLRLAREHGGVDIILNTVSQDPDEALRFPERVRELVAKELIRYPHLIALGSAALPPSFGAKCMELDVGFLLREPPQQIHATVKAIYWRLRTRKQRVTIRVEYLRGNYVFRLCGANRSNVMRLGPQLGRLLLILARGGHFYAVETLATELGISKQSVKKYMKALRAAFDRARAGLLISETGENVFWMDRGPGGTLCGLRANVV
jgi:hypothetical protein